MGDVNGLEDVMPDADGKIKTKLSDSAAGSFGMDNAIVGDYDIQKSPSTENLLQQYLDKTNFEKTRGGIKMNLLDGRVSSTVFASVLKHHKEGMTTIIDDNFWKCFERHQPPSWNFNLYLYPSWLLGVLFRYLVLFPLRLFVLLLSFGLYFLGMLYVHTFVKSADSKKEQEVKLVKWMAGMFFFSWGAVIQYHGDICGSVPKVLGNKYSKRVNPIFVANHTTMADAIVLLQIHAFSLVGQAHKGFAGFLQSKVIRCLQCVWFDRGAMKDRKIVARTLEEHANDVSRNPLLVFPEGTCVNNEYIIQFKKGVFDLGVPVCPVGIKYRKVFKDPFWSSKDQSFGAYLLELMTGWCLICDVYFNEPMYKQSDEDGIAFANRVRSKIASKTGLKKVDFDGYMKHWTPSDRYVKLRQKRFTDRLRSVLTPRPPKPKPSPLPRAVKDIQEPMFQIGYD